ncbi:unnamed protein product [Peniophora sp. CBMAI 1063]|nr:unnamed protein product [Peniophora sp. CBMAI 1063]
MNTSSHHAQPNEHLVVGFIANSFGPENASKIFDKFIRSPGSQDHQRPPAHILQYTDGTYRSNSRPDIVLDYPNDGKGTIVPQGMWQPMQNGDVARHVRDATLLFPIFFINLNYTIGVELAQIVNARPGTPVNIYRANELVPLGNLATTHLCLKWPGYAQGYRKQVEIKDANKVPITMSKLVERIASFVSRFIDEASGWPIDPRSAHWRVGRGFITKDNLYVVGLVHVSAGCWQPVIQLKGVNYL